MSAVPPYAAYLGAVAEGERWRVPFAAAVTGRPGFWHGGALAGLLEAAARAAAGEGVALVTVTTEYLRPAADREARIEARVTRVGGRLVQVEASAWQDAPERPVAVTRATYRRIEGDPILPRQGEVAARKG